jgi:hypothetical protein
MAPSTEGEEPMKRWIAALAVAAGVVLGAGTASADARTVTFVGRVQGSDAYIAIVKDGRKIGGYACNNGTFSRWIEYAWLRNGRAPLVAGTTNRRLGTVRIRGRLATGTIEVEGRSRRFRARLTRRRDPGLHFALGKERDHVLVAGWILLPDGTQRGAISRVNTQTLRPGTPSRAPTLDPDSTVPLGDPGLPPSEPEELVVINIIAILIGLLLPAVQ